MMNIRTAVRTIATLAVVLGLTLALPMLTHAQIKKGTVPPDSPDKSTEVPQSERDQKPADEPSPAPTPPTSETMRTVTPAPAPLERTPGVPMKHEEILIRIKSATELPGKATALADRENGEVEILNGSFPSNNYKVVIFRKEGESVKDYSVFVGGPKVFDCAYIRWKDDTTVIVRLYNTATQQELRCEISGRAGWTNPTISSDY